MGSVIVLGSLNVDLVTRVERHPRPGETVLGDSLATLAGGKGANQAMAAARAGGPVAMIGCVGEDADGRAYRARLSAAGVDVSRVRSTPNAPTGHALITVDDAGENSIVVIAGANNELGRGDLAGLDGIGPGDVLLMQLEVPVPVVAGAVRAAAHRGALTIVNVAPYAPLDPEVIGLVDVVVANEHEALQLADSDATPRSLVVTFGAHGVSWDGERTDAIAVPPEEVLDTTGAGDAFCGALASAFAAGEDRRSALARAQGAGAAAVRYEGAQPDPELAAPTQ